MDMVSKPKTLHRTQIIKQKNVLKIRTLEAWHRFHDQIIPTA